MHMHMHTHMYMYMYMYMYIYMYMYMYKGLSSHLGTGLLVYIRVLSYSYKRNSHIYVHCLKYSILWCIPCTCILLIYRSGWGMLEVGWGLDVRIRLILFQKHCPMISHSFSPLVPKSHNIDSWLFMRRSLYKHNSFYWCLQPIRITEFGHVTSQGYATHGSLETGS